MTHKTNLFFFMLMLLPWLALAQDKKISGTVLDEQSMPMPGVNVILVGAPAGTVTDIDGIFNLTIPSGTNEPKIELSFLLLNLLIVVFLRALSYHLLSFYYSSMIFFP